MISLVYAYEKDYSNAIECVEMALEKNEEKKWKSLFLRAKLLGMVN